MRRTNITTNLVQLTRNRHPKWTCFVSHQFYTEFLEDDSIVKEIRLIWGMKHLVVHVQRDFPLTSGTINREIDIRGIKVRCIDVFYEPACRRGTPYLIIDDMEENDNGKQPKKIEMVYRIAIAYERV